MRCRIRDTNIARAQEGIGSDRAGCGECNRIGSGSNVSMVEAGEGGVAGGAIAKVPEPIGNGPGGGISESHGERPCAVDGAGGECGSRHLCANAGGRIGAIRTITGEEGEEIAEAAGSGWSKAYQDVGRTVAGQNEG